MDEVGADIFKNDAMRRVANKLAESNPLVKRVLTPPPQEKSGIWPWDEDDEEYKPDTETRGRRP
jgi:hypothetical protein